MIHRRMLLAAPVAALATPARAAMPAGPIRVVVPFAPGGTIGTAAVARSSPDGATLLVSELGANAATPAVFANLPYDPVRDFAHLLIAAEVPVVLVAHPGAAPDLPGMVAAARAAPGRLTYASGGVGNASHLLWPTCCAARVST